MIAMTVMTVNHKSAEHEKKIMGRPATGRKGKPLQFYAEDDFIAAVDEWRGQQAGVPGRSEALRRLTSLALESEAKKKGGRK
jgi:hypothetical protein